MKTTLQPSLFTHHRPTRLLMVVTLNFAFLIFNFSLLAQGNLTPTNAPAPTMKTLAQIEPRIDVAKLSGNGSHSYIITNAGSYYLTANLVAVGNKNAINIASGNVTLDLNGFALLGVSNSLSGIHSIGAYTNITVRNGTISGFIGGSGIYCNGNSLTVERVTLSANFSGLSCSNNGAVIRECTVSGSLYDGIVIFGSGCLIIGNNCIGNNTMNDSGTASIFAYSSNNRIEGNHVTGSGVLARGIAISGSPFVTNNIVIKNSVEGVRSNNYFFNTAQTVGPIITNTASGIITNLNPWANFSF